VACFLASRHPLFRNFSNFLRQLLNVLVESHATLRSKCMKAINTIVESDPTLLEDTQVRDAVQCRLMDPSILVRDSAVELVGKFAL